MRGITTILTGVGLLIGQCHAVEHPSIHQLELLAGHSDPPGAEAGPIVPRRLRNPRDLDLAVVGFLPYWTSESHWRALPLELLSHACWFGLEINSSGAVANAHGWPQPELSSALHEGGVQLLLTATLFGSSPLRSLLSSSTARQAACANLLGAMRQGGADGLMIDFEGVPGDQYANFGAFISNLRVELDEAAAVDSCSYTLMACTPAVDWNGAYNYTLLSTQCDALFIMAYDYHYAGSSSTGPVSPATGWGTWNVAWSVNDHLAWNGHRPEKLILGLPWYGYDWPCQSASAGAPTTGTATARSYASALSLAQSHGCLRESAAQTPWSAWQSAGWRQCWYDDTLSLGMKLDLVRSQQLQGLGIWALGYEGNRQELWAQLRSRHWQDEPTQPDSPWNLSLNIMGNQVQLNWLAQAGASGYKVYQGAGPFTPPAQGELIAQCADTSCVLPLVPGLHCYRVCAVLETEMAVPGPGNVGR